MKKTTRNGILAAAIGAAALGGDVAARNPGEPPAAADASKAEEPTGTQAQPRLVVATKTVVAGETVELGVHFKIDKGWHIYWPGQNDSGVSPKVSWKLPEGWKAEPIKWPAPTRYVYNDDQVDHIYEGQVTLIAPLKVPAAAKPGKHEISAEVSWMVCKDLCELGSGTIQAAVEVVAHGPGAASKPEESADAKLLAAAKKRLPEPLPTTGELKVSLRGNTLEIASNQPRRLAFYPHANAVLVESVLRDCVSKPVAPGEGASLKIPLKKPNPGDTSIAGVLEVAGDKPDSSRFYWIDVPLQPASQSSGKP